MFTNSDEINMAYGKECLGCYHKQVRCDILAIQLAWLHCAIQEKIAQYFSRQVSMTFWLSLP